MVLIENVRKNDRVQLKNGWYATVLDNKGAASVRLCKVEGLYTDIGSVYATDIDRVQTNASTDEWSKVTHTANQIKAAKMRFTLGI